MKTAVRDDNGLAIGWTETSDKKWTRNEFINGANYSRRGYIAETLQSLSKNDRDYVIKELGQLY